MRPIGLASRAIVAAIKPGDIVAIGGLARTGKTSWANGLAAALRRRGLRAVVISLDGWIRNARTRPPGATVRERFDMAALTELLTAVRWGGTIEVPIYHRPSRSRGSSYCVVFEPGDVVILEGVVALMIEGIETAAAHRIFVQRPEPDRYRSLFSDYSSRGYTRAEIQALYESRLLDETPAVLDSRTKATVVVESDQEDLPPRTRRRLD